MASVWIILCWNNISLLSLCLFVTQEHRRYLHVCQPRYLSVPPSLISFLARPRLSLYPSLFFLSLSPSRPPVAAICPSLSSPSFVPSSSLCRRYSTLPVRHRFINSLLLACFCTSTERNLRSSLCAVASYPVWLIARLLPPSLPPSTPSPPLRSLFLMLLFSVFLLARLRFSPRSIRPLLEIRFPSSFQYLYFNTILIIFIFNTI